MLAIHLRAHVYVFCRVCRDSGNNGRYGYQFNRAFHDLISDIMIRAISSVRLTALVSLSSSP